MVHTPNTFHWNFHTVEADLGGMNTVEAYVDLPDLKGSLICDFIHPAFDVLLP